MKDLVSHIVTKAKLKGACDLINLYDSIEDLYKLLFSPQGREFCQMHNFPGHNLWKLIKRRYDIKSFNIFIDEGEVALSYAHTATFIGKTKARINCFGSKNRYQIQVQHGASVEINARDYAVVVILNIGKGNRISINKDNTSIILWEGISH